MVQPASGDPVLLIDALTRVPDLPQWIDTRGMLLSGRAVVMPGRDSSLDPGFVVVVRDSALASVVGRPSASVILEAVGSLSGDVNLLTQLDDADYVGGVLRGWRRRAAIVHVLPDVMLWEQDAEPHTRVFTRATAPRFLHVPESLRRELIDALAGRTVSRFVPGELPAHAAALTGITVPMAAAWSERRPVSFCYPVWQTETRWDVSIDTLEAYRGRGLAGRAARTLVRHLRHTGRAPVWGALDTNAPSRALAARLGFIEAAGLAVFTAG